MTATTIDVAGLWKSYRAGSEQAKEQLAIHYAPLVPYMARRVAVNAPAYVDRGDFVSYGYLGLLDALSRFDIDRGIKFETFASRRIRGAILDGLRADDTLTRSARKRVREVRDVHENLAAELTREPTTEEMAERIGVTRSELSMILLDAQLPSSLSEPAEEGGRGHRLVDSACDDPELEAQMAEMGSRLSQIIASRLCERHRLFVLLYYCRGLNLIEVGRHLGISDSRAGQIRLEVIKAIGSTT